MAFNYLLNNMELVKRIYLNATGGSRNEPITKDELLQSSQIISQITPLEVDILFKLTGAINQSG
jgi:solute carrier family 25 aspartate/glutamate transporter 12/13